MDMPSAKSNICGGGGRVRAFASRLILDQGGQGTVEYMLAIVVIVVAMASSLDVLFGALEDLFGDLTTELSKPYP